MKILRYDDYPVAPWKNGQGVTRDIVKLAPEETGFIWRLSLADVGQSGAFSEFDGCDRTITLLDGAGFTLNFEDRTEKTLDTPYEPYDFDGGAPLFCSLLDGPCRDFNLMVERHRASAQWHVHDPIDPLILEPQSGATRLIFCLQGHAWLETQNGGRETMKQWDSAVLDAGDTVTLTTDAETASKLFYAFITEG